MSKRYAMVGAVSGEPLSYGGLILVHDNPAEMEWLLSGTRNRAVELGDQIPDYDTMPLSQHPDLAKISWPLRREDFR